LSKISTDKEQKFKELAAVIKEDNISKDIKGISPVWFDLARWRSQKMPADATDEGGHVK
jgi:hypothetical protein